MGVKSLILTNHPILLQCCTLRDRTPLPLKSPMLLTIQSVNNDTARRTSTQGGQFAGVVAQPALSPNPREVLVGGASPTQLRVPSPAAANGRRRQRGYGYRPKRRYPIFRMEMRRIVVIEEHLDDDAEKPTDFRHGRAPGTGPGTALRAACRLP